MSKIDKIKDGIKRRIESCKTKNGFPAGTASAIRIEAYEELLRFIDSIPDEECLTTFERTLGNIIHSWGTPTESPFNVADELRKDAKTLMDVATIQLMLENKVRFNMDMFKKNETPVGCKGEG